MAYTKYYPNGWKNGAAGGTPITPAALNHMEEGIAAALPNTGGTVTGPVNRKVNTDFDAAPDSAEWSPAVPITDGDNNVRGGVYMRRNTDGSYQAIFGTRNPDSGWVYISPKIDSNGDPEYEISHPEKLRSSIGIGWTLVMATTSSAGVMGLSLAKNRYLVFCARATNTSGGSRIATPFVSQGATNWSALVESVDHIPVIDTQVQLLVGYIDFGAGFFQN